MIRCVSTRWLSLEKCCDKDKYPALKSIFLSRNETRFVRLQTSHQDLLTEIYVLFYTSACLVCVNINNSNRVERKFYDNIMCVTTGEECGRAGESWP